MTILIPTVLRIGSVRCNKKRWHRLLSSAYVDVRNAPDGFDVNSAVVFSKFITKSEGETLVKEIGQRMKRRRFENGHWDSVITGYREVELPDEQLSSSSLSIITKTRNHIENVAKLNIQNSVHGSVSILRWLPCHAIDLSAAGELNAHVDSIKFSGGIVAGISLLSDAIMRLKPASSDWESGKSESRYDSKESNGHVDLYIPHLSLYVLTGMSRYEYTHELLPSKTTFEFLDAHCGEDLGQKCIDVIRGRRLSIIFRDQK